MNPGSFDDVMPTTTLTGLTAADLAFAWSPSEVSAEIDAGEAVHVNVQVGATGTSQAGEVILIGIII